MKKQGAKHWEVVFGGKADKFKTQEIVDILLANRGITTPEEKKDFFAPVHPTKLSLKEIGISQVEIKKAVRRIKAAVKKKEKIIVYGDYDADGVCSTAIMWEALYKMGANAMPYIPERFSEGYGLKVDTIKKLKEEDPALKLIITVDNGIVAVPQVAAAKKLGIDVIIVDHHQPGKKKPKSQALIHSLKTSGSAVTWTLARELGIDSGLELVAIGTIADSLALTGINRSFVKWGLEELNKTKRPGLRSLMELAGITQREIGCYEVGFIVAPRINAAGRLAHAIDSLRLVCTKDGNRARDLAEQLGKTNLERQTIVEEVVMHARAGAKDSTGVIILSHESYHEGVIGLAAGRLVEEFYRPAIVLSKNGDTAKGSARSISGVDIHKLIQTAQDLLTDFGGHTMAAGFSIATNNIPAFEKRIQKEAKALLTKELLRRKVKIDMELPFSKLTWELADMLKDFEPIGYGNPNPVFATYGVQVTGSRIVGKDGKHIKLKLKDDGGFIDAIAFGWGEMGEWLKTGTQIAVAYSLETNEWNGARSLELKVKDIRVSSQSVQH